MIRVVLPAYLRVVANIQGELRLNVDGTATPNSILDEIERLYPMLRGTIRDQSNGLRRPFIRFFACASDISFDSPDAPLPEPVASGVEPLLIVGAIAGGRY